MRAVAKDAFEHVLGYHAAPMLVGKKTANLITFRKNLFADFDAMLASYEECFRCKGVSVFRVSEKDDLVVVMFFRGEAILRDVRQPAAQRILCRYGYEPDGTLWAMLGHLRERIEESDAFPHEIGIFLGYPPGDVEGFIRHKGKNYCCCGYWKVYTNEENARRLFDMYTECSKSFCRQLDCGRAFEELVRAV